MNLSDHIIQEAFENDWHTCFYQPKVEPSIEKVTGVEALFRLDIPEEGIFSPGVFIDRAFALGYEEEIFFSVLEQSLTEVKSLSSHLNLAVNISKKVLANPDNVEKVRELPGIRRSKQSSLLLNSAKMISSMTNFVSRLNAFNLLALKSLSTILVLAIQI